MIEQLSMTGLRNRTYTLRSFRARARLLRDRTHYLDLAARCDYAIARLDFMLKTTHAELRRREQT